jgi:hypothetical protein
MLPVNICRQMYKEINVIMELYGESPEQSTGNVEVRAGETRWVKSHQLQRHLNQSWINTLAPRLGIAIRPTTHRP